VTYTGGYVLPGTTVGAGQAAVADDLEQAAVDKWRGGSWTADKLGLIRRCEGWRLRTVRAKGIVAQREGSVAAV